MTKNILSCTMISNWQKNKRIKELFYEYFKCRTFISRLRGPCDFWRCFFPTVKRWAYRTCRCKRRRKIHFYEYCNRKITARWRKDWVGEKCTYWISGSTYSSGKRPDDPWCLKVGIPVSLCTGGENESNLRLSRRCRSRRNGSADGGAGNNPGYPDTSGLLYHWL